MTSVAWRQNLRLWLPPAFLFLLMVAFLSVFGLKFSDEAEVARSRLSRRSEQLDTVRAKRERAESTAEQIRASEAGLADFYGRRLSSESRALTRIIAEIKDLCERAGIPPNSLSYGRDTVEGQDVFRRTITFSVDGSYAQLRQLINFIELSESFLILDQVALSGNDVEGPLRISLKLSTLFTTNTPSVAADVSDPVS